MKKESDRTWPRATSGNVVGLLMPIQAPRVRAAPASSAPHQLGRRRRSPKVAGSGGWSSQIMSLGTATAPANPGKLHGGRMRAPLLDDRNVHRAQRDLERLDQRCARLLSQERHQCMIVEPQRMLPEGPHLD